MSNKCTICETGDVVSDDIGGNVCTSCGATPKPNAITWEKNDDAVQLSGRSAVSAYDIKHSVTRVEGLRNRGSYTSGKTIPRCENYQLCMKFHAEICDRMKVYPHIKTGSSELFLSVYRHDNFNRTSFRLKMVLVGVCVYIKIRLENKPISLRYMSKLSRCSIPSFVQLMRWTVDVMKIDLPSMSFDDYLTFFCQEHKLDGEVVKYMTDLVPIFQETFLTSCDYHTFFPGLAYLSFMAVNVQNTKMKFRSFRKEFRSFCKEYKIQFTRQKFSHLWRMIEILKVLCGSIPWAKIPEGQENQLRVCFYIDDVVKYQNSLLNEFVSNSVEFPDSEQTTTVGQLKRKADVIESTQMINNAFMNKYAKKKHAKKDEEEEVAVSHNLDSEDLCKEDINDEAVAQYLRSSEEIQEILKLEDDKFERCSVPSSAES